jgi:SAM-dependent methyltransferase
MGLDINDVLFLIAAKKRGLSLGDTLTIGRLDLNVYPAKLRQMLGQAGLPNEAFSPDVPDSGYSEPVFLSLGARSVSALDVSDFEGAEFVHDLNLPVRDELKQRFDLVYDGGTLEHVFNFPVALRNCMEMVREGGRFITHTCANNWCGHGFYQFSPELFYNVLSEDNGFEVERMILHVVGPYNQWYEVANPQDIRSRVELFNAFPLQLLVQARRTKIAPMFTKTPQQSDYAVRWEEQTRTGVNPYKPSQSALSKVLPGLARLQNVLKIGWGIWHGNSLRNRVKFKPVSKS